MRERGDLDYRRLWLAMRLVQNVSCYARQAVHDPLAKIVPLLYQAMTAMDKEIEEGRENNGNQLV